MNPENVRVGIIEKFKVRNTEGKNEAARAQGSGSVAVPPPT